MIRVPPYVKPRHPERVPADATPPALLGPCTGCPAAPVFIVWRVLTKITTQANVFPKAGAGVLDLQLCGHHATEHEDRLVRLGWIVVLDHRQVLADSENPPQQTCD